MNIKEFIKQKIMLDKRHWDKIKVEYQNFKTDFEGKLKDGQSYNTIVTRQGSAATRTIIKPLDGGDKFDLDIAILAPSMQQNKELDMANYLKEMANNSYDGEIGNVAFKTEKGILDIDLVPMFGEIGGSQRVYKTFSGEVINSDNLNLRDDFNKLAVESNNTNEGALRHAVMLMKYALREQNIKGVPSIVINCLAMQAPLHGGYKQALVNYVSSVIEGLNEAGYIHNPSNGEHIQFDEGVEAANVLTTLLDSIIQDDSKKLDKVVKGALAFFGTTAAVSTISAAAVSGAPTSFADE